MPEQNIPVAVHLHDRVLTGSVSIPAEHRLSDFLNSPAKFLKLRLAPPDNQNTGAPALVEMLINKDAINLLSTVSENAARGAGILKRYPYNVKIPVRAKMLMTDFEISGSLYCKTEDAIPLLLEQPMRFLPCTDVKIYDVRNNTSWDASFAAANRDLLYALQIIPR